MKSKPSSYLWTFLAGLAALLWVIASDEIMSDVAFFLSSACFLASVVASLIIALTRRSIDSLYRIAINVIIVLLIFPTRTLGGYLKERLFLVRLPRFQEATDFLIKDELAKNNGHISSTVAFTLLPGRYSDLPVNGVHVSSTAGNITVRYFSRRSNAPRHGGYVYQSDDNPESIIDGLHNAGYGRVAPHWFFWSE
jgi:hypothetical protein